MSDKAAFISSVYSRYRAQTSNVNVISPAFKRLAESEFAFFMFIVYVVAVETVYIRVVSAFC